MTGADQHGYAGRRTNKIEVAGAEQKAKTRLYWWDIGAKRKKRGFFSYGEVFFLLTSPLIECLSQPSNRIEFKVVSEIITNDFLLI